MTTSPETIPAPSLMAAIRSGASPDEIREAARADRLRGAVVEAWVEADLLPADCSEIEDLPAWVEGRGWEAARVRIDDSLILARHDEDSEEIRFAVTTPSGVIIEEGHFSTAPTGLRMMVGAFSAL